jgi:prolyl oligopeptidase
MIMRLCAALVMAIAATPSTAAQAMPSESVSTPHDDHSWLEEQRSPEAIAWAKKRTDAAIAELSAKRAFASVSQELRTTLDADAPVPAIYLLGKRFVRVLRDVQHPSGLLQTAPKQSGGIPGQWQTVLDVGALNARESASYTLSGLSMFDFPSRCLPPAFSRCLLALSPGGSSSLEIREFDLATGAFVDGGFRTAANRSFTAWLNDDTLLITHSLFNSPALPSNFPAVVYLWKRGTPLAAAKSIFQAPPNASLVEVNAMGLGADRRGLLKVALDYSTIDHLIVGQSGALTKIALPQKLKYVGDGAFNFPYLTVQLAADAAIDGRNYAAETILAYDMRDSTPAAQKYSTVYIPKAGTFVSDGIKAAGDGVIFVEDRNLRKTLVTAHPSATGWTTKSTLSAAPGVRLEIVQTDGINREILLKQQGFLVPPTLSIVGVGGKTLTIASGKPIIDARRYVVDVRSARSRDGTMVDYYLVRPKLRRTGPVPTLMSGYGSFGVNFDPDYFSSGLGRGMVSWLTRGGAYVATAIRGGGERGEAWHLAGAGLNKQAGLDDFIGIAEDLIATGFTTPARLGAFGRSAGGLLTAAMIAQRPDLFGAIFVGVPVTDVGALATSGSGIIKGQKAEFGDWDDPAVLPKILAYSPYQNIRAGLRYPRILVMTSTEDNQVGPGQARKFAARLDDVGAKPLFIESPTGGHGVPDPLKQPELVAAELVFFIDALMN